VAPKAKLRLCRQATPEGLQAAAKAEEDGSLA